MGESDPCSRKRTGVHSRGSYAALVACACGHAFLSAGAVALCLHVFWEDLVQHPVVFFACVAFVVQAAYRVRHALACLTASRRPDSRRWHLNAIHKPFLGTSLCVLGCCAVIVRVVVADYGCGATSPCPYYAALFAVLVAGEFVSSGCMTVIHRAMAEPERADAAQSELATYNRSGGVYSPVLPTAPACLDDTDS